MKKNNYIIGSMYLLIFLFFALCAYNFPLTGDDLNWAGHFGDTYFKEGIYKYYDGRYLGDFFIIIMTRNLFFKIFIFSTVCTVLLYLINLLTERKNILVMLSSFLIILLVPKTIFAQIFGWSAGFVNYVPSILLPLLYIYLLKTNFNKLSQNRHLDVKLALFLIVPSILGQFFAEHVTVYNVLLAFITILYAFIKYKKIFFTNLSFLFSSLIGAVLMFMNDAYSKIATKDDAYRSMGLSLKKFYDVAAKDINHYLFFDNSILVLLLSLAGLLIIWKNNHLVSSKQQKYSTMIFSIIFIIYPLYTPILVTNFNIFPFGNYYFLFSLFLSAVFYLGLIYISSVFLIGQDRILALLYLLSALVLAAPFLVVSPMGPRCFFASYVFFTLFILLVINKFTFKKMVSKKSSKVYYKNTLILLATVSIFFASTYSIMFERIGNAARLRAEFIEYQKKHSKQNEIKVLEVPYWEYLWAVMPIQEDSSFKIYMGLKPDYPFIFIPYSQWHDDFKNTDNKSDFFKSSIDH